MKINQIFKYKHRNVRVPDILATAEEQRVDPGDSAQARRPALAVMPNRHVGSRTTAVRWAIAFPSYLRRRSPHSGKNGARPPLVASQGQPPA